MDILFKNSRKQYIQGLKFDAEKKLYEVYMRLDNSEDEWDYVCDVDMERVNSNFKNGVWVEVKE